MEYPEGKRVGEGTESLVKCRTEVPMLFDAKE
jgi:hypothetical protein